MPTVLSLFQTKRRESAALHNGSALPAYGLALGLCLLILVLVLKLWKADLEVPFAYQGDSLLVPTWLKGIKEHGWYLHNDSLGAPYGQDMYDFPMADNLHFLILKLLADVTPSPIAACNLYFLLTFPLTTLSALFVLRRFPMSLMPAIVGSLLFTFLPYHFQRGMGHLCLSAYYLVPLLALVLLELYLQESAAKSWKPTWGSTGIGLLVASAGVYYAFFACYFLLVVGLAASRRRGTLRPLATAALLIAVVSVGVAANLFPNAVYKWTHGANREALRRPPAAAELYGLKMAQLLLPVTGHRLPWFARLKAQYNEAPLVNENDWATLGSIASAGFLFLLGRLLFRAQGARLHLLDGLGLLSAAAFLLGTVGGIGALVGLLLPWIRGYNRISIYIAFFALCAVVWLLDQLSRIWSRSRAAQLSFHGSLALLLIVGILDQTTPSFAPHYDHLRAEYISDAHFVRQIEACVPGNSLIFQLPWMGFPEVPVLHHMAPYQHLKAYLHSRSLRWSYGVVKGRDGESWQQDVSNQPADEMARQVTAAGFRGIYLDRSGYADRGAGLEDQLTSVLGCKPLVSDNQRLVFFPLSPDAPIRDLKDIYSPQEWQARTDPNQWPLQPSWEGGFFGPENEGENSWHWCAATGELAILNPLPCARPVTLRMTLATGHPTPAQVEIESRVWSAQLAVNNQGHTITQGVTLPPGRTAIRLKCDAQPVNARHDARVLVFRVLNFEARDRR